MEKNIQEEFSELPPLIPHLATLVRKAFENIPFFRELYGEKLPEIKTLEDFQKMPLTDRCILGKAHSVKDLVISINSIFASIYALQQNHRTFPFQVFETENEITSRHDRISFCIEKATGIQLTNPEQKKRERFLILYNQSQAFFSSDLASELGWESYQNALVLLDPSHTSKEVYQKIDYFSPHFLFIPATRPIFQPEWIPASVQGIFTFRQSQPLLYNASLENLYDIYTLDEFPYIGVQLPGESFYRYDPWNVYIEKSPHGRLTLTSLSWDNFPWIRYASYDHLEEATEFIFRLRFLGHW